MSDSYLDHLPSAEREKIRKRMRSPEAYERLREKVKGPEDLEQEMERSRKLAELNFEMQSDAELNERVKSQIEQDIAEKGIENILEINGINADMQLTLEEGKFVPMISSHPLTHEDALVVVPEGNVQEKIPVKMSLSDQYLTQFTTSS